MNICEEKTKKVIVALLAVFSLGGWFIASADTSYQNYSVVVGKLNQSTKASAQTKTHAGRSANLKGNTLGKALRLILREILCERISEIMTN